MDTQDYSLANYEALLLVLNTREALTSTRDRLRYGFMAHGTSIGELPGPTTEIYLGSALDIT